MEIEEYVYTIPTHFLSALINGDISGLEDSDLDDLAYIQTELQQGVGYWGMPEEEDVYFSTHSDVNNGAGDAVDLTWYKVVGS